MHLRARLSLATFAGSLLLLLATLQLVPRHDSTEILRTSQLLGSKQPPGFAGDFTLRSQNGDLISLHQFRGQPVILTFLYSTCEDSCPLVADYIRSALDELGHTVPVIAISVDPKTDNPSSAKVFVNKHHLNGKMQFLLGTSSQLSKVWSEYGIAPQTATADHSDYLFLIDKFGRRRVSYELESMTPELIAHDLQLLETERATSNLR